ncbi:MAG: hypothetical protein BWY45_03353 [Euryarchaeota archaeon ADurb.Bin294]|nr:MAG: hypothetical protein BWY45_03353 [Euryarchaeota archaeon ADurb.Bin294]
MHGQPVSVPGMTSAILFASPGFIFEASRTISWRRKAISGGKTFSISMQPWEYAREGSSCKRQNSSRSSKVQTIQQTPGFSRCSQERDVSGTVISSMIPGIIGSLDCRSDLIWFKIFKLYVRQVITTDILVHHRVIHRYIKVWQSFV